jgi:Protein of unknown function (DUF3800)
VLNEFGSYCDEFGHPKNTYQKFFGIAGLVGWSDKWEGFDLDWNTVLHEEKIPKPFHMTDFVQHTEKFSDKRWEDPQERVRILNLLLLVISKWDVIPVGCSVVHADFQELTENQKTKFGNSPYYLAFQEVTANIVWASINASLSEMTEKPDSFVGGISMVYAQLKKFTGPAEGLWDTMKERSPLGHWMSSYTRGDPKDFPPLQAADIWAYSLGRLGEFQPSGKIEADIAFDFFGNLASQAAEKHGHPFFSLLDKRQILIRLGKVAGE